MVINHWLDATGCWFLQKYLAWQQSAWLDWQKVLLKKWIIVTSISGLLKANKQQESDGLGDTGIGTSQILSLAVLNMIAGKLFASSVQICVIIVNVNYPSTWVNKKKKLHHGKRYGVLFIGNVTAVSENAMRTTVKYLASGSSNLKEKTPPVPFHGTCVRDKP